MRTSPFPTPQRRTHNRREQFHRTFMGMGSRHQGPPRARTAQHQSIPPPTQFVPPPTQAVPPPTQAVPPPTQSAPPPTQSASPPTQSAPPPTQSVPPPTQQPTPPQILNIQNVANTCYAVASLQVLHFIGLHHQLLAGQTPLEMNLTNLLRSILDRSSTLTNLPPLVAALNWCLSPLNQFQIGRQQCSAEFMSYLFSSLTLRPFFSTFQTQALCQFCNTIQNINLPNTTTPFLLVIPMPSSSVQSNLPNLVTGALAQQHGQFLTCQSVGCPAHLTALQGNTVFTEHAVSIYWLARNLNQGALKTLTPVQNPDPGNWQGKQCSAVLAHTGQVAGGGHWLAFLRHNNNWWRVDSSQAAPRLEDPFANQMSGSDNHGGGYTIDVLLFS